MNNCSDDDMMEMESSAAPPGHPSPARPSQVTDSSYERNELVIALLAMARHLIAEGRPSEALDAVLKAMKTTGGEEAAKRTLDRARDLYRKKVKESAAADELASLFAECVIEEALPSNSEPSFHRMMNNNGSTTEVDVHGNSILTETGRKQIMLDAFSDGSSFVCLQCGGLVSYNRKDEHYAFWCCKT